MEGASVRSAWSGYAATTPEKLTFTSNKRGRPEISIGDPAAVDTLALTEGRERRRCLECWMLKASYMKVKGAGFAIPLDNFSFYLSDAGRFWRFSLGSRHFVAARGEPTEVEVPPRLVLREVVPLARSAAQSPSLM
jgi:phosphopantetheinyl transferase